MIVPTDVFLTGGSGLVGGHLLQRLVQTGSQVRALARTDAARKRIETLGGTAIRGDVFDRSALEAGMSDVDTVFHVAGVNDTCTRDSGAMDRVNIEGTREVVRVAALAGVRRVVYTSSAAVIGERSGSVGSEATVHSGDFLSPYARSKFLAEIAGFEEAKRCGVDLVAVNPSSVQGPGRSSGSAEILLKVVRSRRPVLVDTYLSIVDIEDCTDGHIAAATMGRSGSRYILSSPAIKISEAVEILSATTERTIDPRWLDARTVRLIGRPLARLIAAMRPGSGICVALIDTLLHGHRFDGTLASEELGIEYRALPDTLGRTVAWFRSEGLLAID
ncbi:MAG: NAD-dependent epimerase/dehydratase family protein [Proteobacteria bacterium]|nr:NAD-dependent epimerase/dehydratase family protein [Pseudomonadota bacterium]